MTTPTPGNDSLAGDANPNRIEGLAGADWIRGEGAADTLAGGPGSDTLEGGPGSDLFVIHQTGLVDRSSRDLVTDLEPFETLALGYLEIWSVVSGDGTRLGERQAAVGAFDASRNSTPLYLGADSMPGADLVIDLAGQFRPIDFKTSGYGLDRGLMYVPGGGTPGPDYLEGGPEADLIDAAGGADTLHGRSGDDSLVGGQGNDGLNGWDGADSLSGGEGDDILLGGPGGDTLDGGPGYDTVRYSVSGSFQAADGSTQPDPSGGLDQLVDIEQLDLTGNSEDDSIGGNGLANFLQGGKGNDTLAGRGGIDAFIVRDTLQSGSSHNEGRDLILDLEEFESLHYNGTPLSSVAAGNGSGLAQGTVAIGAYDPVRNITPVHVGIDYPAGSDMVTDLVGAFEASEFVVEDDYYSNDARLVFAPNGISTEGPDAIHGARRDNLILARGGDDTLSGGAGADTLDGGEGVDTLSYAGAASGVSVELWSGRAARDGHGSADLISGFEDLQGSEHADLLAGDAGANQLEGRGGNDALYGGAGADSALYANAASGVQVELWTGYAARDGQGGSDTLVGIESVVGSAHADLLAGDLGDNGLVGGAGNDSLHGGAGQDTLAGDAGSDQLHGGQGMDLVSYEGATSGAVVELWANRAAADGRGGSDTLTGVERIIGSAWADLLAGDAEANELRGGAGHDSLYGGAGNDSLYGGLGNDLIDGGFGLDQVSYEHASKGVTVELWRNVAGTDLQLYSPFYEARTDADTLAGIEHVIGSSHADRIEGGAASDRLDGGAGDDVLLGGNGSDTLAGGAGSDQLYGGKGDGAVDFFMLSADGNDTVQDFNAGAGGDLLDLSAALGSGGDFFATGHLRLLQQGQDTLVQVDLDAAGSESRFTTIATLTKVLATQMTGANFVGSHAPPGTRAHQLIEGGDTADALAGGAGRDTLRGLAGDDTLSGQAGRDLLEGGSGTDTASYGAAASGVLVDLGAGVAEQDGHGNTDTLHDVENLWGSQYADTLVGHAGANRFDGGMGADALNGRDGADTLQGDSGNDTLAGDEGGDVLAGGAGDDSLMGGAGLDAASYAPAPGPVVVELWTGRPVSDGQGGSDMLDGIEGVIGSAFGDLLAGDVQANRLEGGGGNDSLYGGAGDDTLAAGAGADRLDGGPGADTASYADAVSSVVAELWSNFARQDGRGTQDSLAGIEHISGSAFDDLLAGDLGANRLEGGSGSDQLFGGVGSDTLAGGPGVDFLVGGEGGLTAADGGGLDLADYAGAAAGVVVELWTGRASNDGDGAYDILRGIEHVIGSAHADLLAGTAAADRLEGGAGNDSLHGGAGDDTLSGGGGEDVLHGGAGSDMFQFHSGTAVVADFRPAEGDRILLSAGGPEGTASGDAATVLATAHDAGGSTVISVGGGQIILLGVSSTSLDAEDFSFR